MPPPTVICSVCGQQILKAQTYHVGEGKRACKSHEGVAQKKDDLQQQQQERRQREEQQKKREQQEHQRAHQEQQDPWSHCWLCGEKGMQAQNFYARLAIESKKEQLQGRFPNPFDPQYGEFVRKVAGLGPDEKIAIIFPRTIEKDSPVLTKLHHHFRTAAQMFGVINVCSSCMKKENLEVPLPKLDLEQLFKIGAVMEPALKEAAQKELDREAQAN